MISCHEGVCVSSPWRVPPAIWSHRRQCHRFGKRTWSFHSITMNLKDIWNTVSDGSWNFQARKFSKKSHLNFSVLSTLLPKVLSPWRNSIKSTSPLPSLSKTSATYYEPKYLSEAFMIGWDDHLSLTLWPVTLRTKGLFLSSGSERSSCRLNFPELSESSLRNLVEIYTLLCIQ